jgi:hypothetical protein
MLSIYKGPDVNYIVTYCNFNRISYDEISLWDSSVRQNIIPQHLLEGCGHILVVDFEAFSQLVDFENSFQQLALFLQKNFLITTQDSEGYFTLTRINQKRVHELNSLIPKHSVQLITDFKPLDSHWIWSLDNFNIKSFPTFTSALSEPSLFRLKDSDDSKNGAKNDFMLTMIKKKSRPHRQVLWDQLTARPQLFKCGLALYHQYDPNQNGNPYHIMAGDKPAPNTWIDAYPSMDLYRNSWVEIVPETLCEDANYFTEKTFKPMLTRTPFLVVSTPGYLQYVKSLGFLTFDSLINESYDTQPNIQDRVRLMLNQLEDIVKNGSSSFYHASKHILDHNRSRLAEIIGFRNYDRDLLLAQCFKEFPIDQ